MIAVRSVGADPAGFEDVVAFIIDVCRPCGNSGFLCVQKIGEIIGVKRCDHVLTP